MTVRVGILLFDGVEELDVVGVYEVLAKAKQMHPPLDLSVRTRARKETITGALGLRFLAHDVRVRLPHFPAIGAVFGFLSSLVGSTGPVMSPFFLGYGLTRGAFIATDALCTVGMYIPRGIVFQRYNLMTAPIVGVGLYVGVIMILGAWLGRRILDRLTDRAFLLIIETLIILAGLQFLLFPRQ